MSAVIFAGAGVKTLKDKLDILTGASIISRTVDPRSVATSANIGTLLINATTGDIYKKLDSGSSTNWILLGTPGGHNQVAWDEIGNSPLLNINNNAMMYVFESGLAQELYTCIAVPAWYSAGRQIFLNVLAMSPGTSGNILLQSVSTLVRSETDDFPTTTNQRTSTNSAITMSGANDTKFQKIALDLTDSAGAVNSVAVSPNDLLLVKLTRGTDTDTNDISMIARSGRITW